jgi:hypothetical protein
MSKSGGNPNDEVNQPAEVSEHTAMTEQDKTALEKIMALPDIMLNKCGGKTVANTETFRLQHGSHGGSNVFFNQQGADCRYNLVDGKTGAMYLAWSPQTAMKEVFQNKKGLTESDLDNYCMGIVIIKKDLHVLDARQLMLRSGITLHDLTTANREVTQALARKTHAAGFDGIKFPSNVTGDDCLVLWEYDPSGNGVAVTKEQIRLNEFEVDGKDAADYIVDVLEIPVEEG